MIRKAFVAASVSLMLFAGCGSDDYNSHPTIQSSDSSSRWISVLDPSTNRTFHCLDWANGTWCYEPSPPPVEP